MPTKRLYSMSMLAGETGQTRQRLSAFVDGLGIPTYRGPKNAKCIDDAGRARLLKALQPRAVVAVNG